LLANLTTHAPPFYLRGFEAIEKEIELIKSRDDKKAFIQDLIVLDEKR
jgi:hypothetical protein